MLLYYVDSGGVIVGTGITDIYTRLALPLAIVANWFQMLIIISMYKQN